jgi:DNA-binding beta-propeller fold protein YncE
MRPSRALLLALPLAALTGCTEPAGDDDDAPCVDLLGCGDHSLESVQVDVLASQSDGLNRPRDLEFQPTTGDLYIVNKNETMTVIFDATTEDSTVQHWTNASPHFFAVPSGLAFDEDGEWATSHETDDLTQGDGPFGTPADFMGPTLWTGDLSLYDTAPNHPQHLDMLHNSPNGMGIEWAGWDNAFWYFDGYHSSVTLYEFNEDHGLGGADHSDGVISRYGEGEFSWREGSVSHMALDHDSGLLYVSDTGNGRIQVLDTNTGTRGSQLQPNYDGVDQARVDGADVWTFADGEEVGFSRPSGMIFYGDYLLVSDTRRGNIIALDRESGALVDWLEFGLDDTTLGGITMGPDDNLYAVLAGDTHEVVRISPKNDAG